MLIATFVSLTGENLDLKLESGYRGISRWRISNIEGERDVQMF